MAILPPHLVEQSAVIRRSLFKSPRILVAAPGYLEQYGTPQSPSELANHFLLLDAEPRKKGVDFVELQEGDRSVSVFPRSSMGGNEALLRAAALSGTGVAALPESMVRDDINVGHLTHILPRLTTSDGNTEICIFYAHRELLPARLRTFVDFCTEFFRAPARNDEIEANALSQRATRIDDYAFAAQCCADAPSELRC
jgi:DNA-binding transcriptional LysR family regulator